MAHSHCACMLRVNDNGSRILCTRCMYSYALTVPGNDHVEEDVADHDAKDGSHVERILDGQRFSNVVPLQSQLLLLQVREDCQSQRECCV